jgi:surface protein
MNSILFIYIFSLFVVTSPNFIFKIPIKNHLVVAIIHAVIFSCILYFTYDIVNRDVLESAIVNNGTKQDDGTVYTIDDGTTIVVNNSDKSSELNEIQKNAVNIAELEEQHNQSMLDAANNAAELAKSYAANAAASSTFAIQAASQYNSAATALRLATAAEQAAAEKTAAEKTAAEQSAAERERRRKADAARDGTRRQSQDAAAATAAAAAAAAAEQARQAAIVRVTASVPNAVGTSDYTSGNWVQAYTFNQSTNKARSNTYNLSIPATQQEKVYTAYTTGGTDTYLRVYIGNEESGYNDDSGAAPRNASLQFTIPANHDCIVAYGMYNTGTGSTTLHLDPATSSGTAAAAADTPTITQANIQTAVNAWTSDSTTATATYGHISGWDTSAVTDMSNLFNGKSSFNDDISAWNTSNVTSMEKMFYNAYVFNQNIGGWNTANVTNMSNMFYGITPRNMGGGVFNNNGSATIGNWNTANVTDMSSMFQYSSFNQPIRNWDTSRVTNMSNMFNQALTFNQYIGGWDVSNVTTMNGMFGYGYAFNQNIGGWDVSNVTDMSNMFYSALVFNQNISNWNVNNVANFSNFVAGVGWNNLANSNKPPKFT